MSTNQYMDWQNANEQNLVEDILIETIQIYGQDVFYLPREIVEDNKLFNEVIESKFDDYITVEVYQETIDAFEGDGEIFSRFGIELRNSMKVLMAQRRFREEASTSNDDHTKTLIRPREGDLVYHRPTKGLYRISFVNPEEFSFYTMGKLPVYRLTLELYEYDGDDLDTGVDEIDDFQKEFTPQQTQLRVSGFNETLVLGSVVTFTGGVSAELLQHNVLTGDIALGPLTFPSEDWRFLVEGEDITIGNETGTIAVLYDTLRDERFEDLPFDETDNGTSDNAVVEQDAFDILDSSRDNPLI